MIDLHVHLDGSLEPQDILALAELSGTKLPTTDLEELRGLLSVSPDCTSLLEYLQKFDLPLQVLQTAPALEEAAYRMVRQLARQGLCYAEIRFAPQLHLQQGLNQRQVVEAAVSGLQRAVQEFGMPAQLILCCMRGDQNHRENLQTIETAREYLGKGVCCVDLAGHEAGFPTRYFADIFLLAQSMQVPAIIHAGEAAGPESVRSAIRLGAMRIGHGIHSIEEPELVEELARRKLPLELCYTSNLNTKGVSSPAEYPLKKFLDAGVIVTINTDNMTVSHTTLHQEYEKLQQLYGFREEVMEQIACNSARSAMLPAADRAALEEEIHRRFHSWLTENRG